MSRREVITLDVKAEVSQVKQAAKDIEQSFSKLNLSQSVQKTLNNSFANLTKNIQDFEVAAEKGFSSIKESDAALKKLSKINDEFIRLKNLGRDLGNDKLSKLLPTETLERYEKLEALLKRINNLKLKDNTKAINSTQSSINKEAEKVTKLEGKIKSLKAESVQKQKNIGIDENELEEIDKKISSISQKMRDLREQKQTQSPEYRNLSASLTDANKSMQNYNAQIRANKNAIQNNEAEISKYTALLESEQSVLSNLKTKLEGLKSDGDNTALTKIREDLASLNNSKLENIPKDIQGITNEIQKAISNSGNLGIVKQALEKIGMSSKEASTTVEKLAEKNKQVGDTASEFARVGSEVDALKSRLTYFFSVMNGFQLFKRIIRDAVTSVKELDKAMTETAVVTKKSVQDLWDEMSSYTKVANELGTTTLGAYQAMTLYYQQGLDNAQATALMTETLKMGRIAGLEAKESTDLMTAALRGFNMELNETSAQRVNDVYSNLAANAAANTQEIADAMTRTASIAHSAGMEFETTAAFLTQMIETTRESAENLGTAMKTIVARFTEMKKSPNSIIEVEGETVDVNKVETALRSAGVAARDTSGQFRDVDDVLLELSSKWDSLDVMTQRYIATTAAGSRQQSRFIAMMSNYQRTLELTSYAQNSAGASQKQFEKTTESLESKLNKLHNAWEQLITGIGNQTAIKGVVDLLTGLITTINNVTSAIDPLKTGWSKLLTVILGFKAAKGIANSALQNIGAALSKGKDGKAIALSEKVRKKIERTKSSSSTSSEERKNLETKKAEIKEAKKQLEEEELLLRKKQAQRRAVEDKLKDEKQITEELKKQKAENNAELDSLNGKLTKKQKKRKTYLEGENKSIDRKLLSKTGKGGTVSNIEKSVSDATAEEAAQLQKVKKAHEDVANAEMAEQVAADALYKSNKLGLATKIRYNLQLVFGTKKAKEHARETLIEAGAVTAEGKATEGAGISQWALNASMLACPVMWLVAGIAAVVAAITIFNAIYETAEERAENLSKATEELTNQMNETQQTIGDLKDSWENLTSLKSELDKLTVGTTEWKSKLLEVNQEVINLINKIPELAQYLTKGENGELSISAAGYEKVLDNQQENLLKQQKASLLNQALQAEANQEVYTNKGDIDKAIVSETSKENFLTTSVSQFADDYAAHQEKIGKKLSEQEKIFVKQTLSNKKTLTNFEELRAQTSVDVEEYARLTGLTVEQVKQKREQKELNDDTIRSLIAANKYQTQFEDNAKNLLKMKQSGQINDFTERAIKGVNNFTVEDIGKITSKKDKNEIKNEINKEFANNGLVDIGDDEDKQKKARDFITDNLKIDSNTLANLEANGISLDSILQNILNGINSFDQNLKNLEGFDKNSQKSVLNLKNSITKALGENLTAEQENQISSLFSKVVDQGGNISEVSKIFEDMIPKLKSADDVEKFVQELNNVDFSSETKIRTFSDNLKDFGITLDEKVKNQLVSATNAARDFSMQKVVDELRNQELGETVQEHIKNSSKTFTKDEYTKIKEDLEKKGLTNLLNSFIQRGTSFVFTGNLEELNSGVLGETSLEDVPKRYKEAKKTAEERGKAYNELSNNRLVKVEQGTIWNTPQSARKGKGAWYSTKGPSDLSSKYNVKFNISAGNTDEYLNSLLYKTDESGKFNTTKNGQYILDETKIYDILFEASVNEKFAKSLPKQFFDTVKTIYGGNGGLNLEDINAVSNNDISAVSSIVNILKEQDNISSNFDKAQWGTQEKESYNYLKQYFDKKLINKEQLNQWSKLNPAEIEGKIKQIDPNANVKELEKKLIEVEKTQFTGETSARKIANADVITNEGLTAQKQNINALIQSYDNYEEKVKEIQKLHNLSEDDAKKYLAVYIEQQDGITGITEVMSNYQSIFSKNNMEAKKGTAAYSKALQELKQQAQKTFGDDITTEWVENNIEDLRKLAGGGKEADAALERLKNTTEAAYGKITVNKADPNGKKATGIWNNISKSINDAQKNIKTKAGKISDTLDSVGKSLSDLDKDNTISLEVKDNTRAAVAESLKNYLVALAGEYYAADDESKSKILSDIDSLISFANSNGFGISGVSVSKGKEVELSVPGTNGKAKYKTFLGEQSLEYSKEAVSVKDQKAKRTKDVEIESNSSGNGNNKVTDFNAALLQRKVTYNATYNILKQITALEKEREKLATRLNRLLEEQKRTQNYNLQAIRQNQAAQVANLRQQIGANQSIIATSNALAASMAARTNGLSYNSATHSVQINTGVIGSMTDDEYSKFQSIISMVEGFASNAQTAADKITTAENNIYELTKAVIITEDTQFNNLQKLAVLEREREEHQRRMDKLTKKLHLSEQEYTKEKNKQIKVLKNEVALNNRIKKEKSADLERLNRQTAKNGWGSRLYYNQETGQIVNDVAWFKSQNLNNDEYAIYQDILNNMQQGADVINNAKNSIKTAEDALDDLTQGLQDFKDNLQNFDVSKKIIDQTISLLDKEKNRLKRKDSLVTPTQILNNIQGLNSARNDKNTILESENAAIKKNIKEEILSDSMVKKYLKYDSKTNYFTINRSAYDAITDKTIKDYVDKFFQKGNEYADRINANLLTIEENKDANYDELEAYRQEGMKFDEKVYNAVVKMKEEEVSALNNIDTSIKDAASNLISSIQKNIQKIRQDRQNDKTAKDLQDMEAKLAYLQVDTSNANQKSILDTKKTLEDKQQSYTDTLIDQKITELQRQNDEAAKQRKKQIDIMQAQLELDKKNNVIWDYVDKIKKQGVDTTGRIKTNSELYNLLSKIDNATEKNAMQLKDWLSELQYGYSSGQAYARASSSNTSTKSKKSTKVKAYASGGLVDSTGIAWLDGTKTSPEMVLNPQDTKNFIQLKDILANLKNNKIQTNEGNSNFNFEISIEVDKISSDYDVDKLVNRIKQQITNEARYRNVNTINMIR